MTDLEQNCTLRIVLDVWHLGCWALKVTERSNVGVLTYGIYTRDDGRATTRYTVYGDTREDLEEALTMMRNNSAVNSVAEMPHEYRQSNVPIPGNANRDLLVEHDGTKQISEKFTSRGFVYAAPADAHGGRTRLTLLTNHDRETIQSQFDEIRDEASAEITIKSITLVTQSSTADALPLGRLSHRQHEVFQLARKRGYYRRPKEATARELADEFDITSSTFHEHLHKAEEKILDRSAGRVK